MLLFWHVIAARAPVGIVFTSGSAFNGWRETAVFLASLGVPILVENVLFDSDDGATLLSARWKLLTHRASRRIRSFCPVSTGLSHSLKTAFPRARITALPYGVDLEANSPPTPQQKAEFRTAIGVPKDAFVAVTLGSVHERKGQLPLIEAWLNWLLSRPNIIARLIIVGPRSNPVYNDQIERLIAEAGFPGESVMFTGQVEDTSRYLRTADVYATAAHVEGLPISIVEALAHGLPIVCRWLNGVTDDFIYGSAVSPIREWSKDAFSAAMDRLLDTHARALAGSDARAVAEVRFDLQRRIRQMHDLLTS
jgi:glycosyltransferase involved in cell wall biosynthesis